MSLTVEFFTSAKRVQKRLPAAGTGRHRTPARRRPPRYGSRRRRGTARRRPLPGPGARGGESPSGKSIDPRFEKVAGRIRGASKGSRRVARIAYLTQFVDGHDQSLTGALSGEFRPDVGKGFRQGPWAEDARNRSGRGPQVVGQCTQNVAFGRVPAGMEDDTMGWCHDGDESHLTGFFHRCHERSSGSRSAMRPTRSAMP